MKDANSLQGVELIRARFRATLAVSFTFEDGKTQEFLRSVTNDEVWDDEKVFRAYADNLRDVMFNIVDRERRERES